MSYFDTFDDEYLASMENAIGAAEVKDRNEFSLLPDGKYQMQVTSVAVKEPNSLGGYPSFVIELTVVEGQHKNRKAYKWFPLEPSKERMDALKTDLNLLGVNLTSLRDLEDESQMVLLLDHIVDVTVKNKTSKNNGKTYGNYYLNRVVGKAGEGFQEVDVDDNDVFGGFGAR